MIKDEVNERIVRAFNKKKQYLAGFQERREALGLQVQGIDVTKWGWIATAQVKISGDDVARMNHTVPCLGYHALQASIASLKRKNSSKMYIQN